MSSSMARDGRRRRVLNEEVLGGNYASATHSEIEADAPRYGEQANIEHHPQVSDFVPRKRRTTMLLLAAGVGAAAAAEAAIHFSSASGTRSTGEFAAQMASGLVSWTSAVTLLALALAARLVYSLRRHRVGDVSGRYRVWKRVSQASVLLSANAVMGMHVAAATSLAAATGLSLTTSGAEWWMIPAGLVAAWLSWNLIREGVECGSAVALAVPAAACYGAAAGGALGWAPAALGSWSESLTTVLPLVGHSFALAAMLTYARYVVLDVQGLVDHKPTKKAPRDGGRKKQDSKQESPAQEQIASVPHPSIAAKQVAARHARIEDEGDDEDEEGEDDRPNRKLTKLERKRLKQEQRRAA